MNLAAVHADTPAGANSTAEVPALHFTDVTAASGVDLVMTCGATPSRHILEVNGGGAALFDYDRDGDLDLFLANGATMDSPKRGPGSRLYANSGDGTFTDVTRAAGIELHRWAMGVAVGDYDADGLEDLYVTCYGSNVLLRNLGSGRFADVTAAAGAGDERWGTSAAFGDVDSDGDLDLYVANYLEFDMRNPPARRGSFKGQAVMPGPAGFVPQRDVLYENNGGGTFRNARVGLGCVPAEEGYGLGVVIFDMDADGDQDVFVGNDSSGNFLFQNSGGRFEEIAEAAGVFRNLNGTTQACMGIGLADVDGNGLPDIFVTNFSHDTNTLYLNLGGAVFEDATSRFGLGMVSLPFLSWGVGFYDFDLDGDEDIFISSGHVYPEATLQSMDSEYEQEPMLLERRGRRFERVRVEAGDMFGRRYRGRSVAFGDLDRDGDVDIVMTTLNGPVHIFRNDAPPRSVLVVEPRRACGSAALGSRVELAAGGAVQRRWIHGGSFQSADAPVAYFGMGRGTGPDEQVTVRVTWPDGSVQEYAAVPIDHHIELVERQSAFQAKALTRRCSGIHKPLP